MAVPVVLVGIGAGLVGFIAGALSRQPEINELKSQVRSLQNEVERLHGVINVQNDQIKQLKIRYTAIKGIHFVEKSKQRGYIRGSLIYMYALREYLEMLIDADQSDEVRMSKEEVKFYNAFGKILNNGEITDRDRKVTLEYITGKYKKEIDEFQEPDLSSVMDYIDGDM